MMRPEYIGYFDSCGGENLDVSQRVVRCGDCADSETVTVHSWDGEEYETFMCRRHDGFRFSVSAYGYCAWGTPRDDDGVWIVCKCGHEMEREGMCPFCGRMVREG